MKANKKESERKPEKQKKQKRINREMAVVTYIFFGLFFILIGYVVSFLLGDTDSLLNNPYNKRQDLLAERIVKGSILSDTGKELAKTVTDDQGAETRYYPYGKIFAPVVGRVVHEKTGLEKTQSYTMLTTNVNPLLGMANEVQGKKNPGNNVVTSLNVELSKIAYEGLAGQKGAVVAIDPETGQIKAMISTPTYNPNKVERNWKILQSSDEAVLINRATQGLYPPGSTFKLVTALEYLREDHSVKEFHYTCTGSIGTGTDKLRCYGGKVHGAMDLTSAFAKSCNTSFAKMGMKLDVDAWTKLCNSIYYNKTIPLDDLEQKASSFTLKSTDAKATIRQTAIGQGDTLVTPLQNALLVCAIENQGVLMKPQIVKQVEDSEGNIVSKKDTEKVGTLLSKDESKKLRKLMEATVSYGTATSLSYGKYHAGGKTGSAEYKLGSSDSHSWFIGFGEYGGKKLVVSIVVEGAGTGSEYAVPLAKKMFDAYW